MSTELASRFQRISKLLGPQVKLHQLKTLLDAQLAAAKTVLLEKIPAAFHDSQLASTFVSYSLTESEGARSVLIARTGDCEVYVIQPDGIVALGEPNDLAWILATHNIIDATAKDQLREVLQDFMLGPEAAFKAALPAELIAKIEQNGIQNAADYLWKRRTSTGGAIAPSEGSLSLQYDEYKLAPDTIGVIACSDGLNKVFLQRQENWKDLYPRILSALQSGKSSDEIVQSLLGLVDLPSDDIGIALTLFPEAQALQSS